MDIDTLLTECKIKGFVTLVKTTNRDIRAAILEAEGRGYLYKSQAGVYRLTPLGFSVLDAGGVELYRSLKYIPSNTPSENNDHIKPPNILSHWKAVSKWVGFISAIIGSIVGIITLLRLFL